MENAPNPGPGKKPQKKTPARPSSPNRKPAPARKPAARKPTPRPTPTQEPVVEPVVDQVDEPVEALEVVGEEATTNDETPAFSVPTLTVPQLGAAAVARASRAVIARIKPTTKESPEPTTEVVVAKPARKPARRPARKAEPVLTVSGLTKRFDDTVAVDGIDLVVPVGAFYGIVGPNGAGKTTTLSMVTGLLRPDSGTVTVHGADVWADPVVAKRNMGVLPDRLRLFDRLTGSQLLFYSGVLRGLTAEVTKKRSSDLAAAFGLEDALGRLVSDYSAGMTKKIALAAAMIHSPRLLVLDEPFESVDPVSAATVTDILKGYTAAGGTVLLSSHSMDLVQRICDNVAVVVGGSILADGTMASVRGSGTLEERFVELAGGRTVVEGLEWLHSFSD